MQQLPETSPVARANIANKLLRSLQHSSSPKLQKLWAQVRKNQSK